MSTAMTVMCSFFVVCIAKEQLVVKVMDIDLVSTVIYESLMH